jgi:hypothetical protein
VQLGRVRDTRGFGRFVGLSVGMTLAPSTPGPCSHSHLSVKLQADYHASLLLWSQPGPLPGGVLDSRDLPVPVFQRLLDFVGLHGVAQRGDDLFGGEGLIRFFEQLSDGLTRIDAHETIVTAASDTSTVGQVDAVHVHAPSPTLIIACLADLQPSVCDLLLDPSQSLGASARAFALSEVVHAVKDAPPRRRCL